MYESHWQLSRRPFDPGSDATWYYPSEAHQAALLKLRYAVENRCPAALVAGASGTGKTLLVRLLAERLGESFRPFVHLVYPAMPTAELLAYLAAELTGGDDADMHAASHPTIDQSVRCIQQFIEANAAEDRHAVIAIDEAHLIEGARTFEALRLLLNFEAASRPGLTLLLVGQSSLLPIVDRMPQFDERLAMKCLLRALTETETMSYVRASPQARRIASADLFARGARSDSPHYARPAATHQPSLRPRAADRFRRRAEHHRPRSHRSHRRRARNRQPRRLISSAPDSNSPHQPLAVSRVPRLRATQVIAHPIDTGSCAITGLFLPLALTPAS